MGKCLVIIEVSQKQAFVFASNKLKDNIRNSAIIADVTSSAYFESTAPLLYNRNKNEVYCGGGHAVLQFDDKITAQQFIHTITLDAKRRFDGLELFATLNECEEEPNANSIFELIKKLEKKKAFRRASFYQGTFGIEKIDSTTRTIACKKVSGQAYEATGRKVLDTISINRKQYRLAYSFENLGGSVNESNFIAVIHIDGNAMGKRVEQMRAAYGKMQWEEYRIKLNEFSQAIDTDFKNTYDELCSVVETNISDGAIGPIILKEKDGNFYFPMRKVITEGDDICFVTEGRIGIECARIFLELLSKKENCVDHEHYAAAAGVAIVHQKYPFYRAYELAEELCANAKKYIANVSDKIESPSVSSAKVSAIDWHIEYGEMKDTLDNIRDEYETKDGFRMELRPYFVQAPKELSSDCVEKVHNYRNFKKLAQNFSNADDRYARGKIKELRKAIKSGEHATENYIRANMLKDFIADSYVGVYEDVHIENIGKGKGIESRFIVETLDGKRCSTLFDAIECMDIFVSLEG